MSSHILGASVRNDRDDIIEIKLWDNQYHTYYKRKARVGDKVKIAEMLLEIKQAYGVDLLKDGKKRKEINWFE